MISIRIDEDILSYFRSQFPSGYQTAVSNVLRDYVTQRKRDIDFVSGRAQEIYRQFHAQCFWHLKTDLRITPQLLPIIIEGLKKNGGRRGFSLAAELEQLMKGSNATE